MTIGTVTTLVGLINATIGGSMLMLPVLSMKAGYLDWGFGCTILCLVCMYTAYLLVKHLGKAKNIKFLILGHFKGDHLYTTIYNIVIWFSFMSTQIIYFKLFCIQI
jgi:amino acid permease